MGVGEHFIQSSDYIVLQKLIISLYLKFCFPRPYDGNHVLINFN